MFNLRFFSPFILILIVIAGFFHFLWLPGYIELERQSQIKHEQEILVLLGEAILPSLLSADYAEIYSIIDQVKKRHESFIEVRLLDNNRQRLYPITIEHHAIDENLDSISHEINYKDDVVGVLEANVNIREYIDHEVEEIKEFESIVIGLLLALIGVTAFLQYRWINTPLRKLAEATSKISKGDYNVVLPEGISHELKVLISSFDLMQSDLKKRENQLYRRKEIEDTIRDIQTFFITVQNRHLVFQKILDHLIFLTGSQIGLIGETGYESNEPYLDVYSITNLAWDVSSRKMYEQSVEGKLRFSGSNNLFGEVLGTGQVVISEDPKNDPRSGGFPKGHPALENFLGVPLYNSKSKLVGMVGVANSRDGYSQEIVDSLDILWLAIGNLIEAQRGHEALLEREEELDNIRRELMVANERLEGLVRTDGLTDIANRRHFDEMLKEEFNRAYRQHSSLALILFDIDQFKPFNDHYGHSIGDQALIRVAQTAARVFQRTGELVARYGGEEFAIIVPYPDPASVKSMAEKLLEEVRRLEIPHATSPVADHITISAGIALIEPDRESQPGDLIMLADKALYQAKQSGRDRAVVSGAAL